MFLIDLFTWTIIKNASQKHKVKRTLEVPLKALFKPNPNEQNNFDILTLNKKGAS